MEDFGVLSPEIDILSPSHLQHPGIYAEKGVEGLSEVADGFKETVSRHNRADAHMNSQGLWQHAQGLP